MNTSERKLFTLLKSLGFRVVPQARIGDFTVDFLLPSEQVIVEADGKPYHSDPETRKKATRRDRVLQEMGYFTIHVWTDTLFRNEEMAKTHILTRLYRELGIKSPAKGASGLYRKLSRKRR